MKKIFSTIAILLLAITLAACNGDDNGGDLGDENPERLVVWADNTYWGGENGKLVSAMLDEYEAETGIEVIYEAQPDLDNKLRGASLGGESPDLIIWDRWQTTMYINDGLLVNLDQFIKADAIDTNEYQQEALNEMIKDGSVYGFPLDIDAWGYWVNKTLLAEAGINELPSTWDELRTAAIALTKYDGSGNMTRAGINLDSPGAFFSYIQTAGGSVFTDNDELNFNSAAGASVLTYWYDMIHVDKVFDKAFGSSQGGADDPFVTQRFAIQSNSLLNGSQFYKTYIGDKFEYEFIPYPQGPSTEFATTENPAGTNHGGLMGGFGLAVPKTATYKKAAWNLIKWWITDTDNQVKWSEISGLIPAKLSIIEDPRMKEIPNVRNIIDSLPYIKARPKVSGYTSIETSVFMNKIGSLLFEGGYVRGNDTTAKRVQACLNDMEQTAQSILDFAKL